jgi:large subunit ribosomal protein L13Ae
MFWKAVRGMVPHKTRRGKIALARLKVFEGIPPPYDKQKRVCVPLAMKILCLRSDRKYCQVGRVAHEVGWQYKDVVSSLEAKRKIKARLHFNHKQRLEKLRLRATQKVTKGIAKQNSILKKFGYVTSENEVKAVEVKA